MEERSMSAITIEALLKYLESKGCKPSIYCRAPKLWRAHINRAGNFWHDAETPLLALLKAFAEWEENGNPIDGAGNQKW